MTLGGYIKEYLMIYNTDAMEQMKNPLSPVKMVRESYSRWLQTGI